MPTTSNLMAASAEMQKLNPSDGDKMASLRRRQKHLQANGSAKQNGFVKQNGSSKHNGSASSTYCSSEKTDALRKMKILIEKCRNLKLEKAETHQLFRFSAADAFLVQYLPTVFRRSRRCQFTARRFLNTSEGKKLLKKVVVVLFLVLLCWTIYRVVDHFRTSVCLLTSNSIVDEIYRPRMPCHVCQNLTSVPEVTEMTGSLLRQRYAYTPLVVRGAAMLMATNITYHQLKQGFTLEPHILQDLSDYCQFFPYNTEFTAISQVFNMTDSRADVREGEKPWYIGWCNCVPSSRQLAHQLYNTPDFLQTQTTMEDHTWIFMGGPGHGAGLHIDVVQLPSWQAQLSGRKRWTLVPPYECESQCQPLEVVVNTGDVIILDTNVWFHGTEILPGGISITVGAEFD